MTIERVLGIQCNNNNGIDINEKGEIIYTAGGTIILYNLRRNKQIKQFIRQNDHSNISSTIKRFSSLTISINGKLLVAGENGHDPLVVLWDTEKNNVIAEFKKHQYGIIAVAMDPFFRFIISIGTINDPYLYVWNLKSILENYYDNNNNNNTNGKVYTKPLGYSLTNHAVALDFAENALYFVTAEGNDIKFRYLKKNSTNNNKIQDDLIYINSSSQELETRVCIMPPSTRDNVYIDVKCGKGSCTNNVFALASNGNICQFNIINGGIMEKMVSLKTPIGKCLSLTPQYLAVGGNDGIARLYRPESLEYCCTLPKPSTYINKNSFPSVLSLRFTGTRLVAIYSDSSFYIYDLENSLQPQVYRNFHFHNGRIWDIQRENDDDNELNNMFLTCSSDNTIRFWSLNGPRSIQENKSKEDIKYISSGLLYNIIYDEIITKNEIDHDNNQKNEIDNGIRTMAYDCGMLVTGNSNGLIQIYQITRNKNKLLTKSSLHTGEVLQLVFFRTNDTKYLVSGGRDRLTIISEFIEINGTLKLKKKQVINDFSAAINSIIVMNNYLLISAADKSFLILEYNNEKSIFVKKKMTVIKTGCIISLDICYINDYSYILGLSGKTLTFWNTLDFRKMDEEPSVEGENSKIKVSPDGNFLAVYGGTGVDKSIIKLYDMQYIFKDPRNKNKRIELIERFIGHYETITNVLFTNDGSKIISVSTDSIIIIFTISDNISKKIRKGFIHFQMLRNDKIKKDFIIKNDTRYQNRNLDQNDDNDLKEINIMIHSPSKDTYKNNIFDNNKNNLDIVFENNQNDGIQKVPFWALSNKSENEEETKDKKNDLLYIPKVQNIKIKERMDSVIASVLASTNVAKNLPEYNKFLLNNNSIYNYSLSEWTGYKIHETANYYEKRNIPLSLSNLVHGYSNQFTNDTNTEEYLYNNKISDKYNVSSSLSTIVDGYYYKSYIHESLSKYTNGYYYNINQIEPNSKKNEELHRMSFSIYSDGYRLNDQKEEIQETKDESMYNQLEKVKKFEEIVQYQEKMKEAIVSFNQYNVLLNKWIMEYKENLTKEDHLMIQVLNTNYKEIQNKLISLFTTK